MVRSVFDKIDTTHSNYITSMHKTPQETKNTISVDSYKTPIKREHNLSTTSGVAIFIGLMAAAIGATKGVKSIINRPPKQVIEILDAKILEINDVINKTKEIFTTHYKNSVAELSPHFKRTTESTQKVTDLTSKINVASTKEEVLQTEESCFDALSSWFEKNIKTGRKTPEELATKYSEIAKRLQEKLNKAEQEALEQIKTIADIPKEIKNNKRAKKVLDSFNFQIDEAKRYTKEANEDTLDALKKEGKKFFIKYNDSFDETIKTKNDNTSNIISEADKKLVNFVNLNLPVSKISNEAVKMDIIPSDMPKNILNITNLSIEELTQKIGEDLSLKDIQTLIQRLELRQKANVENINFFNWYNKTIKQLKDNEAKISEYLENSFYNSGKNIDVNSISLEQEQKMISALQQHSKMMGFSSIKEMIEHFAIGDIAKDGQLSKDCSARIERYNKSTLSKIYPKIKDKCDISDNLFESVIAQKGK